MRQGPPVGVSMKSYDVNDTLNRALSRLTEYRQSREVALLLYAALDVRLCIERTLFEYLVLIKNDKLSKRVEKLYSASDLKKAILDEDPQFVQKIEFMNLFVPFMPYEGKSIITPDLALLSSTYGQSNGYLHVPKCPEDTWENESWWERLHEILDAATKHLVEIHSNLMGGINLNEKGQDLFDKFVSGGLSIDAVKAILEEAHSQSPLRKA